MAFITSISGQILLTFTSIIIGGLFSYGLYRLQKRDVTSARIERSKRAKEEMLDILESNIVNKQTISSESIANLIEASEREYETNLRDICTSVTLLQDVVLRLQRSRHLDIVQKTEYTNQINQMISVINQSTQKIPTIVRQPIEIATVIEQAIKNNQNKEALETIDALKKELKELTVSERKEVPINSDRYQIVS